MSRHSSSSFWKWVAGGVGILIVLLLLSSRLIPSKPTVKISDPSALPGIQTTDTPWQPELANLAGRLRAIGLPALSAEGSAMHIHQHLDIFIDGKAIPVPAGVGINQAAGFISPVHVHDNSGIIHVESPKVQTFTLGQFFDVWGVKLTAQCIGGYCADSTKSLKVYSNGTLYQGDLRQLALQSHQEIVIVYGTDQESPQIPSTYAFPVGY
ncbi:MAG: hypothetical protein KGH79_04125 [Patescibacteria group bacterium]|nr:hypothetical protein [Patescibacteria group bacterium]